MLPVKGPISAHCSQWLRSAQGQAATSPLFTPAQHVDHFTHLTLNSPIPSLDLYFLLEKKNSCLISPNIFIKVFYFITWKKILVLILNMPLCTRILWRCKQLYVSSPCLLIKLFLVCFNNCFKPNFVFTPLVWNFCFLWTWWELSSKQGLASKQLLAFLFISKSLRWLADLRKRQGVLLRHPTAHLRCAAPLVGASGGPGFHLQHRITLACDPRTQRPRSGAQDRPQLHEEFRANLEAAWDRLKSKHKTC